MTQRERGRLVTLKKAGKKLLTQKQAAQQTAPGDRRVGEAQSLSCETSPKPFDKHSSGCELAEREGGDQAERRSEPERPGRGRLLPWRRRKPSPTGVERSPDAEGLGACATPGTEASHSEAANAS